MNFAMIGDQCNGHKGEPKQGRKGYIVPKAGMRSFAFFFGAFSSFPYFLDDIFLKGKDKKG
jgi:hypothetical protein